MIRLETEIIRLSVTAMILTWKWIIRMLKMNPDRWPRERHQEKFSKDITDQSRHQDFENYLKSSSLQLQLIWKKTAIAPKYLNIRCPIFLARTLAQLRLANTHNCRILCSEHCLQLCPKTLCKACGKANEIVDHILSFCQAYDDLRIRFFTNLIKLYPINLCSLMILSTYTKENIENIARYISAVSSRRARHTQSF
ncbi:hypothetical protein KQX54_001121 [Cotesia glomerata]|uniref:Reverse transcriptase zinc-binding domain-containing protein n=1 Tax=Cotesia glomerata TaxID=32391 RepID=A0AAV7HTW5_COTGL|nr:hypothetical protein KQX54_001121 [Cotesia glomerata]